MKASLAVLMLMISCALAAPAASAATFHTRDPSRGTLWTITANQVTVTFPPTPGTPHPELTSDALQRLQGHNARMRCGVEDDHPRVPSVTSVAAWPAGAATVTFTFGQDVSRSMSRCELQNGLGQLESTASYAGVLVIRERANPKRFPFGAASKLSARRAGAPPVPNFISNSYYRLPAGRYVLSARFVQCASNYCVRRGPRWTCRFAVTVRQDRLSSVPLEVRPRHCRFTRARFRATPPSA